MSATPLDCSISRPQFLEFLNFLDFDFYISSISISFPFLIPLAHKLPMFRVHRFPRRGPWKATDSQAVRLSTPDAYMMYDHMWVSDGCWDPMGDRIAQQRGTRQHEASTQDRVAGQGTSRAAQVDATRICCVSCWLCHCLCFCCSGHTE